jgi:hypothetical protein
MGMGMGMEMHLLKLEIRGEFLKEHPPIFNHSTDPL